MLLGVDGVQSAEYTISALRWDNNKLTLAKMREPLAIRFSRTIPKAAKVTISTISKDCAALKESVNPTLAYA